MEIDGPDTEAKAHPKAEESGDSWSDTSGEFSLVSDGGASASAESTTEEGPKGQIDIRPAKSVSPKRRFTHCPEKKYNSSTYFESCTRRTAAMSKPYFKRGRYLRNKLETIFEHPVVTADNKVLFLRQLRVSPRPKRKTFRSDSSRFLLNRHNHRAVKKSVEEVDQLMMNLDIQQENPVT
uniref:Uncharacterized protein n=1 Tax=Lygus hesperus TaxID=30085 RepID=A0A0K8S9N5_LYGHE